MPKNVLIAVAAVIIIAALGSLALKPRASTPPYAAPAGTSVPPATDSAANASSTGSVGASVGTPLVVTLTDDGFSPETLAVKAGQTVTFVNQSRSGMWIASDPHPTHQGYSGTTRSQHCPDTEGIAFDECTVGDSYTFTFRKVGSWGYHNHVIDEQHGTIVVSD
jgi:plastocyanin